MTTFLKPDDEDAFLDFPLLEKRSPELIPCPQCKGHGGWNLKINDFSLPQGMENTPENRHKYCHFRAACSNCNGYGYVSPERGDHVHNWVLVQNLGRCYNRYKCECGATEDVDSSD